VVDPRARTDLDDIPVYRPGRAALGSGPTYKLSSN
jgi:hypothetical protein